MEIDQEQAIEEVKNDTEIGKTIMRIEHRAVILSLQHLEEKHFENGDEDRERLVEGKKGASG